LKIALFKETGAAAAEDGPVVDTVVAEFWDDGPNDVLFDMTVPLEL
jgi:hypothetical protein